jgi:hypothetical protein
MRGVGSWIGRRRLDIKGRVIRKAPLLTKEGWQALRLTGWFSLFPPKLPPDPGWVRLSAIRDPKSGRLHLDIASATMDFRGGFQPTV